MHPSEFRSLLASEAASAGFELSGESLDRMAEHNRLLVKWNRAVRLIGSTDPATVIHRHILESLRLLPQEEQRAALSSAHGRTSRSRAPARRRS